MANSVDSFIPKLWSAKILDTLRSTQVATAFYNTDYEGEIKQKGDTVHVNSLADVTINTYTGADLGDPEDLNTVDQTLIIDQADDFHFMLKDIKKAQVAGDLMTAATNSAAYKMAEKIDKYLFAGLATNAGITIGADTPVALLAENIYDTFVEIGQKMDEANVPQVGRRIAVSPAVYALLLKSPLFVGTGSLAAEARAANASVGEIAGFTVYKTNNLPTGKIVADVTMAASYATQLTEMEAYRYDKNFADVVKGLQVYGSKVFRPDCVACVTYTIA